MTLGKWYRPLNVSIAKGFASTDPRDYSKLDLSGVIRQLTFDSEYQLEKLLAKGNHGGRRIFHAHSHVKTSMPGVNVSLFNALPHSDNTLEQYIHQAQNSLLLQLLSQRINELIEIHLSSWQKYVYINRMNGLTFQQIAEKAIAEGIRSFSCKYSSYTAVNHCYNGIKSTKPEHDGKFHGGVAIKIGKKVRDDEFLQLLLQRHQLVQAAASNDKFNSYIQFLSHYDPFYAIYGNEIIRLYEDDLEDWILQIGKLVDRFNK